VTSDSADGTWSIVYVGREASAEDGACASFPLGHRKTRTAASA
jgi:hypothetical protein